MFLLIGFLTSCKSYTDHASNLLNFVPEHSELIISGNSLEGLSSAIVNNALLQKSLVYPTLKTLREKLQVLNHFETNDEFLICLSNISRDSMNYMFLTKANKDLFNLDSIPNKTSETFTSKRRTITKTTVDKSVFFSTIKDSVFIGSDALPLLENVSSKNTMNPELEHLFKISGKDKSFSVIINLK
ncbi:MAG TPA: hypothetical protein VJ945_00610, partial [Flavobacteriaceae bacterium]|nr:hypothetical protein [Flavobacteriaceae bacterium]